MVAYGDIKYRKLDLKGLSKPATLSKFPYYSAMVFLLDIVAVPNVTDTLQILQPRKSNL